MTKKQAIELLRKWGWNRDGAEVIVKTAIEQGTFEEMTEKDLRRLHEDYANR